MWRELAHLCGHQLVQRLELAGVHVVPQRNALQRVSKLHHVPNRLARERSCAACRWAGSAVVGASPVPLQMW